MIREEYTHEMEYLRRKAEQIENDLKIFKDRAFGLLDKMTYEYLEKELKEKS